MSVGLRVLHFKVAYFIGLVHFDGTAKMKLAKMPFLYCGEFMKSSKDGIQIDMPTEMPDQNC